MSSFLTARLISTCSNPHTPYRHTNHQQPAAAPTARKVQTEQKRCSRRAHCKVKSSCAEAKGNLLVVEDVLHNQALLHGHLVFEGHKAKAARSAVRLP